MRIAVNQTIANRIVAELERGRGALESAVDVSRTARRQRHITAHVTLFAIDAQEHLQSGGEPPDRDNEPCCDRLDPQQSFRRERIPQVQYLEDRIVRLASCRGGTRS
jgi:hypothetical protein